MIFDSTKKAGKLSDGTAKGPQHMSYDTKAIVDRLVDVYSSMSSFTPIDNFQRSGKTWFNFGDEFTDGQHTYGLYVSVKRNRVALALGVEIYAKVATENGRKTVVELEQYLHEPDYRTGGIKAIRSLMEKMRQDLIVAAKREGLKQTRTGRRKSGQMDDSAREYYEDRVAQTWRLTPKVKEVIKELQEDYDRYLRLQQEGSHHKSGTDALLYVSNSSKSWTITNSVNFTYYEGHLGWSMIDESYVLTEVRFDGRHYADIYTPIDVSKIKASYDKSEDYLVSVIERGNERGLNLIASLGIDTEHRSPK